MIMSMFDQTRESEDSSYGEAVRLSNEFRAKPARTIIDPRGNRIDLPARNGFDVETADFIKFAEWINDTTIRKSQSNLMFCLRIIALRFPIEFSILKNNLPQLRQEMELIESQAKNEVEWLGLCGYTNLVRLDGSLTYDGVVTKKLANDKYRTVSL